MEEESIIIEKYDGCVECPDLCEGRGSIVWGFGVPNAKIMLVGEAPGKDEDREGIPFVGKAGEKLWELLAEAHIVTEVIHTTNAVLCRPTVKNMEGRLENRKPTNAEIKSCRGRLMSEICTVDPIILVAMGGSAIAALLGREKPVAKMAGKVLDVSVSAATGSVLRYPIVACYHPSYFLKGSYSEEHYLQTVGALKFAKKIVDFALAKG